MTTFSQIPRVLNLDIVRGDDVEVVIDFDADLTGHTASASLLSVVSGAVIAPLTATISPGTSGIVTVQMSDTETLALQRGTYRWELSWTSPAGATRKSIAGFVEVRG